MTEYQFKFKPGDKVKRIDTNITNGIVIENRAEVDENGLLIQKWITVKWDAGLTHPILETPEENLKLIKEKEQ